MLPALLVLAGVFALLFLLRLGAARRSFLTYRWPALAVGAGALTFAVRGALWPALILAGAALALWTFGPALFAPRPPPSQPESPDAVEARRLLGVGPEASAGDIRQAYRERMRRAHPDRGGSHAQAARLTAARDLLLKRKR